MPSGASTSRSITPEKASPVTSSMASCSTVYPPPEYCHLVPGSRTSSTAPAPLEFPLRASTNVGSGSVGKKPG